MSTINIQDLFKKVNFKPNDAQYKAIVDVNQPLYLVAGPGSGKTRVLLWRVVNLIVFHNVKIEEIFLSTFTEKAAMQLKEGLMWLLGLATQENKIHYDISDMYVGTVHSLCQKFILDNRFKNNFKKKLPVILQELDQYFHIYDSLNKAKKELNLPEDYNECLKEYMCLKSSSKHEIVSCLISVFNRFSEESLSADEVIYNADNDVMIMLGNLYKFYLESLNSGRKKIDLSLLQQYGYKVLLKSENSGEIFKHVIIDEYQDTNNIQEKIFFKLSGKYKNICVVGDDDQSLYRFRGATVENFVQFDKKCESILGIKPQKIKLNINYRSRKRIVDFYKNFMEKEIWESQSQKGMYYRNVDKNIKAFSKDDGISVVTTICDKAVNVYNEIAKKIKEMIDKKIISDPSEIAVLFTYLKGNQNVQRLKEAFERFDLKVYAPRAGKFLENEEPMAVFGLYLNVFGIPYIDERYNYGRNKKFNDWMEKCYQFGIELIEDDFDLKNFIEKIKEQLTKLKNDYGVIKEYMSENNINIDDNIDDIYKFDKFKRGTMSLLSNLGKYKIQKKSVRIIIEKKIKEDKKINYRWLVTRINSVNWNLLDLFYKLCKFEYLKCIFDEAENMCDEGPMYNLSNVTTYIQFFIENKISLITGKNLYEDRFMRTFFTSYLGAIFRREEGNYEIKDEPIPKGRISFLTIHQSKGLEFPVVILGAIPPCKNRNGKNRIEEIIRPYLKGEYEPLEKVLEFDRMRSYYVALSRAENLLILPHFKGTAIHPYFKDDLKCGAIPLLDNLDIDSIPKKVIKESFATKVYSYTSDFLFYNECPRKYMIYKKYGFVPARTTISFFGNLVNKTLEDIHNYYISLGNEAE
ncbi:UvrD-helicase domain-containing protein [Clostridium saccharobutylicum]|uniref:DNA 3'-5' helicase n=1 Tax=Clostridium saccharobutylicum DSM 13864 TaxID=1345695 RepID=U5MRB6_CLOSA|nr:ATP-dependent helicase [Clostridium saccharobutylicum]AGX43145.1 ATP-dependent DNA helicase UvrD1 [Clostridium saccharobutylicum DSM 13864]AQR90442.1 ATP-dependent DNA helicase UvrD1 [Clostridium saccharobutylicum]AQS00348.1 ATP-dependent DNA helicase UvrD1 [Clostridium saccharobutylicum]AQS14331.1 ATP-dependent DNA helicase UvrD1 [Clostridium saccharobutylicum]MBA2906613.1 DNA helicase-2/ATP-dependent DNA helicase PcrA [Clostridium saccharobutylicum]